MLLLLVPLPFDTALRRCTQWQQLTSFLAFPLSSLLYPYSRARVQVPNLPHAPLDILSPSPSSDMKIQNKGTRITPLCSTRAKVFQRKANPQHHGGKRLPPASHGHRARAGNRGLAQALHPAAARGPTGQLPQKNVLPCLRILPSCPRNVLPSNDSTLLFAEGLYVLHSS